MTLVEVIDAARDFLNEPIELSACADRTTSFPDDSSSFFTDTRLRSFFNLTQQEMANELIQVFEDYLITATTVDVVKDTEVYNLPSDFIKMRRVEDTRYSPSVPLEPILLNDPEGRLSVFNTVPSSTNFLSGYKIRGTQIVLGETPAFDQSAGLRLYYIKRLADVESATNSSELPGEYHNVMVWGVVEKALISQQASTEAIAEARTMYRRAIQDMKGQAERRQTQRPRRVLRRSDAEF